MFHYDFNTSGSCAKMISFDIDDEGKIHNVFHHGGCAGNLKTVAMLVEGMSVEDIEKKFTGIDCGGKGTSCSDQLAKGVKKALEVMKANA